MRRDKGMTVLEVVVALTILMIGVGFVFSGNKVIFHYKAQHELRQQMFFYAAGLVEAELEGVNITESIGGVSAESQVTSVENLEDFEGLKEQLEMVTITVRSTLKPDIEPVVIKTMRFKP